MRLRSPALAEPEDGYETKNCFSNFDFVSGDSMDSRFPATIRRTVIIRLQKHPHPTAIVGCPVEHHFRKSG